MLPQHFQLLPLPDCQLVCEGLSARSSVSCIKISRSSTVSTIDLLRAVCKEQRLLSQDPLVLLLVPQQVRDELFHNEWRLHTQNPLVPPVVPQQVCEELFHSERHLRSQVPGSPSSPVCLGYPSYPLCLGYPSYPLC